VKGVAVVIDCAQCLQRGADVVEVHLLRVQRPAGCLDVVLEFLAALIRTVALAHRDCPDPASDSAEHRVLGINAVREEERKVGSEVLHLHAASEVRLNIGETIGEGEGQLRNRVRPGFGDVVTGDGHRIEIAHLIIDEPLLDVAHAAQGELRGKDARVLALILFENVRLNGASDVGEHPSFNLGGFFGESAWSRRLCPSHRRTSFFREIGALVGC